MHDAPPCVKLFEIYYECFHISWLVEDTRLLSPFPARLLLATGLLTELFVRFFPGAKIRRVLSWNRYRSTHYESFSRALPAHGRFEFELDVHHHERVVVLDCISGASGWGFRNVCLVMAGMEERQQYFGVLNRLTEVSMHGRGW